MKTSFQAWELQRWDWRFQETVNKLKSVVVKEGKLLSEISGIDVPVEEKAIEEYVNQVLKEVRKAKGRSG